MSDLNYDKLSADMIEMFDESGDIESAVDIIRAFWIENGTYSGIDEEKFIDAYYRFSIHVKDIWNHYPSVPDRFMGSPSEFTDTSIPNRFIGSDKEFADLFSKIVEYEGQFAMPYDTNSDELRTGMIGNATDMFNRYVDTHRDSIESSPSMVMILVRMAIDNEVEGWIKKIGIDLIEKTYITAVKETSGELGEDLEYLLDPINITSSVSQNKKNSEMFRFVSMVGYIARTKRYRIRTGKT